MRILSVTPYIMGMKGTNPDHLELLVRLQRKGHYVWALSTRYQNELKHEVIDGVNIFRFEPLVYLNKIDYGIAFPFYIIYKWVKTYEIDVVLGLMETGTTTLSAALIATFLRKPFILIIQGPVLTSGIRWVDVIQKLYDLLFSRLVALLSTHIVLLSDKLVGRALAIGGSRNKVCVIPSGINLTNFDLKVDCSTEFKESIGFTDNDIVIGYCGRLVNLKGLSFLMRALALVKKRHREVGLLLIGDGPLRYKLEEEAKRLGIACKVTGWVDRSEVPRYVAALDIYVSSSLSEGLPISIMEAMAMQKPVVATDVGGTCDLVKDGLNGFLCPPATVFPLANAIEALIDKEKRLKMGIASRKLIETFSCERMVNRFELLLRAYAMK